MSNPNTNYRGNPEIWFQSVFSGYTNQYFLLLIRHCDENTDLWQSKYNFMFFPPDKPGKTDKKKRKLKKI